MNKRCTNATPKGVVATKSSRTLYIPKGAKAYLVVPGEPLPEDLEKVITLRAEYRAKEILDARANQTVNARIPTSDELAAQILHWMKDHSEGEQNRIIAIVLHRRQLTLKDRIAKQQHVNNQGRDILLELQEAENQLDAITLGNAIVI